MIEMRIIELHQKAHKKGLNVDGSREMLIATLEKDLEEDTEETLLGVVVVRVSSIHQ